MSGVNPETAQEIFDLIPFKNRIGRLRLTSGVGVCARRGSVDRRFDRTALGSIDVPLGLTIGTGIYPHLIPARNAIDIQERHLAVKMMPQVLPRDRHTVAGLWQARDDVAQRIEFGNHIITVCHCEVPSRVHIEYPSVALIP